MKPFERRPRDIVGEVEDVSRGEIAGIEIDEAPGKLVDHHVAGLDRRDLERGRREPDNRGRSAQMMQELRHHEEYRQQIDRAVLPGRMALFMARLVGVVSAGRTAAI
jgi:hypothetical protein